MGFSISRLTLYAILSSIEEDMRNTIRSYLFAEREGISLFGEDTFKKCQERLSKDQQVSAQKASLGDLVEYIDYAEAFQIINKNRSFLPADLAEHFREMTQQLEKLVPVRNRVMHSRPLDYEDLSIATDIARQLVLTEVNWINLVKF